MLSRLVKRRTLQLDQNNRRFHAVTFDHQLNFNTSFINFKLKDHSWIKTLLAWVDEASSSCKIVIKLWKFIHTLATLRLLLILATCPDYYNRRDSIAQIIFSNAYRLCNSSLCSFQNSWLFVPWSLKIFRKPYSRLL